MKRLKKQKKLLTYLHYADIYKSTRARQAPKGGRVGKGEKIDRATKAKNANRLSK